MKLEVARNFAPLEPQSLTGIPDFMLITGLNGSGKSILLQSILGSNSKLSTDSGEGLDLALFADCHALNKEVPVHSKEKLDWELLEQAEEERKKLLEHPDLHNLLQEHMLVDDFLGSSPACKVLSKSIVHSSPIVRTKSALQELDLSFGLARYHRNRNGIEFGLDYLALASEYAKRWSSNRYNRMLSEEGSPTPKPPLTELEFTKRFGPPPWKLANKFFHEWNLDIHMTEAVVGMYEEEAKPARLLSVSSDKSLSWKVLSSGERTLLMLLSEYYQASMLSLKPQVLLLDEPDAMLNPALSKSFVKLLAETFTQDLDVKVIMTTHSPATVAAAPDGSHYVMEMPDRTLQKASREEAIAKLFVGTPELTLLTENTRQVFCEGGLDVAVYRELFRICLAHYSNELIEGNLNFISFGKNPTKLCDSNRVEVEELVKRLVDGGNVQARGLVDWDRSSAPDKPKVVQSSKEKRYSIENLVLDPYFLAIFIMKLQLDPQGRLPASKSMSFLGYLSWTSEEKQGLIDELCAAVKPCLMVKNEVCEIVDFENEETVDISYSDGNDLMVPKWWLISNGHKLEEAIKSTFAMLNSPSLRPLCHEVVKQVNSEIKVVPTEIFDTFNALLK